MAIAYGARAGSASGATSVSSFTVTTTAAIPAGSTILVSIGCGNVGDLNDVKSVTDSAGNTYVAGVHTVDAGQNTLASVWYSTTGNALASGGTVTITLNVALLTSGMFWTGTVDYLTGGATTTPTDGTNSHNGQTTATWDTNSITTTNAADLVWVFFCTNQGGAAAITNANSTPTTGWTTLALVGPSTPNTSGAGYQVFAATGTYKGGGTDQAFNNGTSAVIIAFKAAAGGTTPIAVSDSATGTETVTLATVAVPVTDAAVGSDSPTLLVQIPIVDTGAGGSALNFATVAASVVDSAAATETLGFATVAIPLPTDAAAGSDALTLAIVAAVADAAAGSDTVGLAGPVTFTLSDPASGAEVLSAAVTLPPIGDAGVGSSSLTVVVVGPSVITPEDVLFLSVDGLTDFTAPDGIVLFLADDGAAVLVLPSN